MKRYGMIEIPLKLRGKNNLNGLLKLNLISIIEKGNCLLDMYVQCARGSFLPKSPGHPNSVGMGRWWQPPGVVSTSSGVNPPQSASLGDAVETRLPRAKRQI